MHSSSLITLEIESPAYCGIQSLRQSALLIYCTYCHMYQVILELYAYRKTRKLRTVYILQKQYEQYSGQIFCYSTAETHIFTKGSSAWPNAFSMFKTFRNKNECYKTIGVTRAVLRIWLRVFGMYGVAYQKISANMSVRHPHYTSLETTTTPGGRHPILHSETMAKNQEARVFES